MGWVPARRGCVTEKTEACPSYMGEHGRGGGTAIYFPSCARNNFLKLERHPSRLVAALPVVCARLWRLYYFIFPIPFQFRYPDSDVLLPSFRAISFLLWIQRLRYLPTLRCTLASTATTPSSHSLRLAHQPDLAQTSLTRRQAPLTFTTTTGSRNTNNLPYQ